MLSLMKTIQHVQYSCSLQQILTSNCEKNPEFSVFSFQPRKLESQAPSSTNRHTPPPLVFVWGKHCLLYVHTICNFQFHVCLPTTFVYSVIVGQLVFSCHWIFNEYSDPNEYGTEDCKLSQLITVCIVQGLVFWIRDGSGKLQKVSTQVPCDICSSVYVCISLPSYRTRSVLSFVMYVIPS